MKEFLRQYLPNFCWLDTYDVIAILEEEYKGAHFSYSSVKVTLRNLEKEGTVVTKQTEYGYGHIRKMYIRIS